jgi:hypothetical protein
LGQLMIWYSPPRGVFIISMYFIVQFSGSRHPRIQVLQA